MELYSYNKYRGFHLYVEAFEGIEGDQETYYEGQAQHNGATFYRSSESDGDLAESKLKLAIDKELDDAY